MMNFPSSFLNTLSNSGADCHTTLTRLIGNLRGFVYRRRYDARWTMDFLSTGFRDVTGYDPHRFVVNGSIAFSELIDRSDRKRVEEEVRLAVLHRRRATIGYVIRAASGGLVQVEDRLTPVVDGAGRVIAIEGIIDQVHCNHATRRISNLTNGRAKSRHRLSVPLQTDPS